MSVTTSRRHPLLNEHFLLLLALVVITGLFVHNNVLWRWDNLLYDAQLSLWSRPAAEDIVIIAIDDESLNELGRWPWPRSEHAALIRRLSNESPSAIGLDIIFSEPDNNDPFSDVLLALAIRANGKVVLPVLMAQQSNNSFPIEALPLPEFTANAAALGHVHIDISDDGIARRIYLREGIDEPQWPHISLALLDVAGEAVQIKDFDASAQAEQYSVMRWARQYPFLIPFAGPPGHFTQIGFSQVMSGEYPKDLFRDKIVLIGATAEGMGDALITPFSGQGGVMPGVEIIANVIDAIRNDIHITEISPLWLLIFSISLVALPLLLYPYFNPAGSLLVLSSAVVLTVTIVSLLLFIFGVWLPASTILLFQFIGYPLWSWRRLAFTMRHINAELNALTARQQALSVHHERNLADEIRFISQFIPIKGWTLLDSTGQTIFDSGSVPACNLSDIKAQGWSIDGYRYWAHTEYRNKDYVLGLSIGIDSVINDEEMRLLDNLLVPPGYQKQSDSVMTDVLQSRVEQVQTAASRYEELRLIIDDALSGMADGVLICSSCGQVMLSNHRACWYLYGDDDADINGRSLLDVLQPIRLKNGENWNSLLQGVLFRHERVLTHTRMEDGRELMLEISPIRIIGESFDGFVVNFSDISLLKESERIRNEALDFLSHDLRSPLSSMIAMIELAKTKSSVDEIRPMLLNMENNTHKTLHLAEQFLQLSRANTSENIQFYDIDFNNVVLNAIDQLWALSQKMRVSVQPEFDSEELWIHAEPDLLERAILNLLSNAIKHSDSGSVVTISLTHNNNEIMCCVADTGSGILMEDLPHLFEMFRRTKGEGVERKQGIGLGLAFVDAVAKRHGGHVDVESRLGEGSSFYFRFPRVEPSEVIE